MASLFRTFPISRMIPHGPLSLLSPVSVVLGFVRVVGRSLLLLRGCRVCIVWMCHPLFPVDGRGAVVSRAARNPRVQVLCERCFFNSLDPHLGVEFRPRGHWLVTSRYFLPSCWPPRPRLSPAHQHRGRPASPLPYYTCFQICCIVAILVRVK